MSNLLTEIGRKFEGGKEGKEVIKESGNAVYTEFLHPQGVGYGMQDNQVGKGQEPP
jgi:hypothetical protein